MLSPNWKTFIAARTDNTAGEKHISVFTKAWLPKKSFEQQFQTLTADPNMVLFAADSSKKLQILPTFKNTGRKLNRPETKLMYLSGDSF
jgi:hypothetical protein